MISQSYVSKCFGSFHNNQPFDHCVIDNFLNVELAKKIDNEFLAYNSATWVEYQNTNQVKKMFNDWYYFSSPIYQAFFYLNSPEFVKFLSDQVGCELYSDPGLHSGGCHIHTSGGFLSPHLDYSLHPKINLYRKLNLIVFVSENFLPSYGGHLELWEGTDEPNKLIKQIAPIFNRAVIFDTTDDSWHSVSKINCPDNVYRKSLAVYYLTESKPNTKLRTKANFETISTG